MKPTGVLMVGSVPGGSANEVFTRLTTALPDRLCAIPDGETGERWFWVHWQLHTLPAEARTLQRGGVPLAASGPPTFTLADLQSTGYGEAALASYAEFERLRQQNVIPPDVRFQVCLPTPYAVMTAHVKPELAATIEPLYEQRMVEAIDQISAKIPHHDVIIQFDLCFEITALEFERGRIADTWHKPYMSSPVLPALVNRIIRICEQVPDDIKLGFHICYGDFMHKHFVEPQDTSLAVELANGLLTHDSIGKRIEWIHLPVPKDRTDSNYFSSLVGLKLNNYADVPGASTPRLYLGLVHANDETGTQKRIETAQATVPFPFGVATQCGMARTPPEEIDSILQICKEVTA